MLLPSDFTFVDLQTSLGHRTNPLLALLAAVHGQVVDIRSFICNLKVADTAVPLWGKIWKSAVFVCVGETNNRTKVITTSESNLATEVDDSSVWVEEWQKDSAAGVQFLQGQWLSEVLLLKEIQICPLSYHLIISSVTCLYRETSTADCR